MYKCYISLGANLGIMEDTIKEAISQLDSQDGVQVKNCSSLYSTPAWGKTDQPEFINATAILAVDDCISPEKLLDITQRIENNLGRVRHEHWGPRTIDIDLLYIPNVEMNTERLILPHPYMLQRGFVLIPLQEIAPQLIIKGKMISDYITSLPDEEIRLINKL